MRRRKPRGPARQARSRLLTAAYFRDTKIKFAPSCVSVRTFEAVNINLTAYARGILRRENIADASFRQTEFHEEY